MVKKRRNNEPALVNRVTSHLTRWKRKEEKVDHRSRSAHVREREGDGKGRERRACKEKSYKFPSFSVASSIPPA